MHDIGNCSGRHARSDHLVEDFLRISSAALRSSRATGEANSGQLRSEVLTSVAPDPCLRCQTRPHRTEAALTVRSRHI